VPSAESGLPSGLTRDYHRLDVRLIAFSHPSGVKLAEVGFLLFLIAGVWIVSASLTKVDRTHTWHGVVLASGRFRMIVAGGMLAGGGLLLIIAAHWGHLFS
jgi:hypothetical protein